MIQETLSRINAKKTNPNDIRVKPLKTNDKATLYSIQRKMHITHKEATIKAAGYFSMVMT